MSAPSDTPPPPLLGDAAEGTFALRTLGPPALERLGASGRWQAVLPPGKPFALLVYLALAPRRTASRAKLVDLLWANAETDRARQTLRQTLSQLRDLLGAERLATNGDDVSLAVDVRVDATEFMRAVREGRIAEGLALYGRPFLHDFTVPGGDDFDEWAMLERQRLQGACRFALEAEARTRLDRKSVV